MWPTVALGLGALMVLACVINSQQGVEQIPPTHTQLTECDPVSLASPSEGLASLPQLTSSVEHSCLASRAHVPSKNQFRDTALRFNASSARVEQEQLPSVVEASTSVNPPRALPAEHGCRCLSMNANRIAIGSGTEWLPAPTDAQLFVTNTCRTPIHAYIVVDSLSDSFPQDRSIPAPGRRIAYVLLQPSQRSKTAIAGARKESVNATDCPLESQEGPIFKDPNAVYPFHSAPL